MNRQREEDRPGGGTRAWLRNAAACLPGECASAAMMISAVTIGGAVGDVLERGPSQLVPILGAVLARLDQAAVVDSLE